MSTAVVDAPMNTIPDGQPTEWYVHTHTRALLAAAHIGGGAFHGIGRSLLLL